MEEAPQRPAAHGSWAQKVASASHTASGRRISATADIYGIPTILRHQTSTHKPFSSCYTHTRWPYPPRTLARRQPPPPPRWAAASASRWLAPSSSPPPLWSPQTRPRSPPSWPRPPPTSPDAASWSSRAAFGRALTRRAPGAAPRRSLPACLWSPRTCAATRAARRASPRAQVRRCRPERGIRGGVLGVLARPLKQQRQHDSLRACSGARQSLPRAGGQHTTPAATPPRASPPDP